MKCIWVEAQLDFDEKVRVSTPYDQIYETVIGSSPPENADGGDDGLPGRIREDATRLEVIVGRRSWRVRSEQIGATLGDLARNVAEQFERAEPNIGGLPIRGGRFAASWVEPFDGSWDSLLTQYGAAFLAYGTIGDDAFDTTVIYEGEGVGYRSFVQSGPMKLAQLERSWSVFSAPEELSPQFLFLHYHERSTMMNEGLGPFIERAMARATRTAQERGLQFERAAK